MASSSSSTSHDALTLTTLHHDGVSRLLSASSMPRLAASHSRSFARCVEALASGSPSRTAIKSPRGIWGSGGGEGHAVNDEPTSAALDFNAHLPTHFAMHNARCRRCGVALLPGVNAKLASWRRRGRQRRASWGWQCCVCGDRREVDKAKRVEAGGGGGPSMKTLPVRADQSAPGSLQTVMELDAVPALKRKQSPPTTSSIIAEAPTDDEAASIAKRIALDPLEARRQALRQAKRDSKSAVPNSDDPMRSASVTLSSPRFRTESGSSEGPREQPASTQPMPLSSGASSKSAKSEPVPPASSTSSNRPPSGPPSTKLSSAPPSNRKKATSNGTTRRGGSNDVKTGLQALLEKDRQRKAGAGTGPSSGSAGANDKKGGMLAGFLDSLG